MSFFQTFFQGSFFQIELSIETKIQKSTLFISEILKLNLKLFPLKMKENSLSKSIKKPTPVVLIDQDQQKKNNLQLIGKMFGNLSESINVGNNSLGNKNANPSGANKFSAGFKQPSILKNNKTTLQQKDSNNNKSQLKKLDVFTVYDQFGLINDSIGKRQSTSKGKPKYRDDPHPASSASSLSNPFKLQDPSTFLQMKNQRKQQFQQVMSNNYVNLHEYYDLAKEKGREQTVIHVKSSLDNMTLQNVEAKLEAHRRELKNVEQQYKLKKGVVEKDEQQENDSYNNQSYQPNKTFTKTGDGNPYQQYGKTQSQIYEMIKKNQKDDPSQIVVDQMWQQKLKQNPKLLEYSKKYQQYLVQKDAKNILFGSVRQNLFKWDKFTQPQSHHKSTTKIPKKSLSKQKSISKLNKSLQKFQRQASLQKSQYLTTNIRQVLASKDDKFIAKYIFAQVDVDKRGLLSKQELLDYITKNEHIIKSYSIDLKWIYTDLDNYGTKRKGMLNKEQLAVFLATFQRTLHPEIKLTDLSQLSSSKKDPLSETSKKPANPSPFQIHFAHDLYRFKNLFEKLDLNDDKILKRQQFIQNIFIDSDCSRIIDKVVIKIKIIDKEITYRQIIGFVLDDFRKERNEKLKKSKEYITFDRFCEYFQMPETINLKSIGRKKASKAETTLTNEVQIFDLQQQQNLLILKDVFDTIPRVYQDFIVTADFIQTALIDPQILSFQQDMCRIQSVQTNLPIQTVRLTLQRMIKQSDQYIDWQTAKCFFSRRGRPMEWNQALIREKKAVRQEQRGRSINEALKRQLIMKNQLEISAKMKVQYQSQQKRQSQTNFTIPQPFKITDQIKQKQKPNQTGQNAFKQAAKQLSKTQQHFKAKPVNKQILGSKPSLIQGKRPQSPSKQKPSYHKYENYENDRIQRALKKAQEKYQFQQKQKEIKEMANIKANKIGVDLTKNLFDIMKEDKKKVQSGKDAKKPLTQIQKSINERLHPTVKNDEEKIKKLQEKIKKQQEMDKEMKKKKQSQVQNKQDLIKKTTEQAEKVKKQKQQAARKLKEAAAKSQETFKPKLNPKKQLSEKEKQALQQGKRNRELKKQQQMQATMRQKQAQKKRILERQLKDPYLKIDDPENPPPLTNEQIIDKIYSINIFEILLDKQQKQEFNNDHDFLQKDKKQREIYLKGMANKMKIIMEKQEKVLKDLKIREKEEKQQSNIMANKEKSGMTQKGKSDKMKSDMIFHGSKALLRYRKIQQGMSPSQVPSQFDRYKDDDFDDKNDRKKSMKIIKDEEEHDQEGN